MLSFAIRMLTKQKITLVLASSVDVVPKIHPTSRFRSVLNSFHWQLSFHCNLSYWHLLSHGQFSSGWTYIELFTDTAFVPWPVILRTKRPGFKQNNKFVGKWQSFIEGGKYIGLLHTAHLMGNSTSRQMVWIMGFPLPPPVIANFSVDDTEERALAQAAHKPLSWFRYVDDNFVIWPLESEKLENFFFDRLNGLHRNTQFTVDIEIDYHLSFLALTYTGDLVVPWTIRSSENLPTQNPTWALDHIILPTYKLFC